MPMFLNPRNYSAGFFTTNHATDLNASTTLFMKLVFYFWIWISQQGISCCEKTCQYD